MEKRALIPNRIASLVFKVILACCATAGVLLFVNIDGRSLKLDKLMYYTGMSNLMVAISYWVFVALEIRDIVRKGCRQSSSMPVWYKNAVTLIITVTFLIYHFLLSGGTLKSRFWRPSNIIVHYAVPIMCIIDWLLFDPKFRRRWFHPLTYPVFPVVYFIFTVIRAEVFGGWFPSRWFSRYPYGFIDVDRLGNGIYVNIILTATAIIVLGYLYWLADWGIGVLIDKYRSSRASDLGDINGR